MLSLVVPPNHCNSLWRQYGDRTLFALTASLSAGPFGEHYLGNEVVHHLTNQGYYSLQVDLKAWDGETRTAHYRHLWLESEEQGQ